MAHDISHEVSITKYVYSDFFGSKANVIFKIRGFGEEYNVTFNNATDLRFGGKFKTICRELDAEEGDYLVIKMIGLDVYSIDILKGGSSASTIYLPFFTGSQRHLIASVTKSTITKQYHR